jgi:hypothetical protein
MAHFPGLGEVVVFYPEDDKVTRLSHPAVWEYTKYCMSVTPQGEFAEAIHFLPAKTKQWNEYLIVADYLPDEDDFEYRRYGNGIAQVSGFDMTGKRVSDFDSEVGRFFYRQYRQCITDRKIIHSEHHRVHARTNCTWVRSICPVRDGDTLSVYLVSMPVPLKEIC